MASRSPSPVGTSPVSTSGILTGRSRLNALLAAQDSGSENSGSDSEPTISRRKLASLNDDGSSGSEEEEEVFRPRGRFAAKMMGEAQSKSDNEEESATARERLRRQLMKPAQKTDTLNAADSSEDEEIPTARRRLATRRTDSDDEAESTPTPKLTETATTDEPLAADTNDTSAPDAEADAEAVSAVSKNPRLQALLERKRQERLAREAEEEAKRAARQPQTVSDDDVNDEDVAMGNADDDMDDFLVGGTDQPRKDKAPKQRRQASKRAVEEMHRETQRMQRNMQLVHEAKTRKRFEKKALFDLFGFKPEGSEDAEMIPEPAAEGERSAEGEKMADGKTAETAVPVEAADGSKGDLKKPSRKIVLPTLKPEAIRIGDEELEIVDYSNDRISQVAVVVERMDPGMATLLKFAGNQDDHAFRHKEDKVAADLWRKAREQAKAERDARIKLLESKGVHVPTEEEREREAEEVEDILARAREENERIRKAERAEARMNGEVVDDDSDDESFRGSGDEKDEDEEEEMVPLELSGSEDEEEEEEEEEGGEEGEQDVEMGNDEAQDDEEELEIKTRRKKTNQVLSDDEDEDEDKPAEPLAKTLQTPQSKIGFKDMAGAGSSAVGSPSSAIRSAKKTFIPGLTTAEPAAFDLQEMFAGTFQNSQVPEGTPKPFSGGSMPDFTQTAFPMLVNSQPDDVIMDSQVPNTQIPQADDESQGVETQGMVHDFSLKFLHGGSFDDGDGFGRPDSTLSEMENLQLSQDRGLGDSQPIGERFISVDATPTQDTVVLQGSPAAKPRLRTKEEVQAAARQAEAADEEDEFGFGTRSAHNVLKEAARKERNREKKAKKRAELYDRDTSAAKGMVEEQAEESDDEYAGLGGADGDISDDSDAASVQEMIDDETKANAEDEEKLAAFYNERELIAEEAHVQKLYKDITTGALRRKRGADYTLSDSESDGERQRRMKRRQFAKMQRELMADERLRKTAENPENEAFIRAITSQHTNDEIPIIDMTGADDEPEEDAAADSLAGPSKTALPLRSDKKKRREKKAMTLKDVRSQLSSLLDDPYERAAVVGAQFSDEDAEERQRAAAGSGSIDVVEVAGTPPVGQADASDAPRMHRAGSQVIDRLSMKRSASSASAASGRAMAFAAPGAAGQGRTRSLLRGATSALMASAMASGGGGGSTSGTGSTTSGGVGDAARIRKGATKGSGLSGFARENERRAALAESEKKREERKLKGAEKRAQAVGGLFGTGKWE